MLQNIGYHSFYDWVVLHNIYITFSLSNHPFLRKWVDFTSYCELNCCKQECTDNSLLGFRLNFGMAFSISEKNGIGILIIYNLQICKHGNFCVCPLLFVSLMFYDFQCKDLSHPWLSLSQGVYFFFFFCRWHYLCIHRLLICMCWFPTTSPNSHKNSCGLLMKPDFFPVYIWSC